MDARDRWMCGIIAWYQRMLHIQIAARYYFSMHLYGSFLFPFCLLNVWFILNFNSLLLLVTSVPQFFLFDKHKYILNEGDSDQINVYKCNNIRFQNVCWLSISPFHLLLENKMNGFQTWFQHPLLMALVTHEIKEFSPEQITLKSRRLVYQAREICFYIEFYFSR